MTRGWPVSTCVLFFAAALLLVGGCADDADTDSSGADEAPDPGAVSAPSTGGSVSDTSLLESGVLVTASGCRLESFGAGVIVAEGIATNAHVVAGATSVSIFAPGGGDPVSAEVVAWDPRKDLALLRPEATVGQPLQLGQPVAGSDVIALARGDGDAPTLTPVDVRIDRVIEIRISDIYGDGRHERDGLELSGALGPGDSGAGLVDASGAVVGVVFSSSRARDGVAYAVASSEVTRLAAEVSDVPVDTGDCRR